MDDRHRDSKALLCDFAVADIDVVCPRCSRRAAVRRLPCDDPYPISSPRRLICHHCGVAKDWTDKRSGSCWGGPVDPYFRRPLWLRAPCRHGRILWAFNRSHLDELESFVAARLRERGERTGRNMTMAARLPAWMKSAKHRDEMLRAMTHLRARLAADRSR
ncbi:hypothetical protein Ade02nite_56110 [Paractinoplanes deccanensis]|uniref:Uncharacterized protein n=1 Tax=Paractinoplanes deccanensis TaxID=113561 RepID=A0ABQ3YAC8_9ACTN|nr:hypothetical protein [Actinoplanes deccanensis]GID76970.1 hypothetical protein Ade02nite_56110 [Actinoplanes deccanensis]